MDACLGSYQAKNQFGGIQGVMIGGGAPSLETIEGGVQSVATLAERLSEVLMRIRSAGEALDGNASPDSGGSFSEKPRECLVGRLHAASKSAHDTVGDIDAALVGIIRALGHR